MFYHLRVIGVAQGVHDCLLCLAIERRKAYSATSSRLEVNTKRKILWRYCVAIYELYAGKLAVERSLQALEQHIARCAVFNAAVSRKEHA
jgi:hypothetical protein